MTVDLYEPVPGSENFGKLAPMLVEAGPIFIGEPKPKSVRQQRLTSCPLPAVLAATAHADPSRLYKMIHYTGYSKPRTAWFRGKALPQGGETLESAKTMMVYFQHRTVEITPRLYADDFAKLPRPRFAMADDGSGWVSYIEKAYVVYRGNYEYRNLDFLGEAAEKLTVSRICEDVWAEFDRLDIDDGILHLDDESDSFDPPPGYVEAFEGEKMERIIGRQALRKKVVKYLSRAAKRPTIATTVDHTLAVLGLSGGEVTLFDCMRSSEVSMSVREFIATHDAIYQVRK